MPTNPTDPGRRPGRFVTTVCLLAVNVSAIGLVVELVAKVKRGTVSQRYKNWQGLSISYTDMMVLFAVALAAATLGLVWSWLARRREERQLIEAYRKKRGS